VPYQPSVAVPLVVAGPGVAKGLVSEALVSVMDLAATYLDYGGVARPKEMDSRSLRPVLEGQTGRHREYVLSGLGTWRTVWDGRYKLVRDFDPAATKKGGGKGAPALLFDLETDALENENLAAKSPGEVRRLGEMFGRV
jgi:arylsulfatase A-like enzyme